jgi:polar amino acid transport system substrate-binding protein
MPDKTVIGPQALAGSTPLGGTCQALPDVAPAGRPPAPGHMPAGSTMAEIEARGYLRVGVDQTTLHFGFRDASGNLVGFDDSVAQQVANAIFGNKPDDIRYTVITSAQRIPFVQDEKVDLVADNMTITCDRLQQVAFSEDYYNAGQTLLVPANSHVTTMAQLTGQRVCAAAGTTSINKIGSFADVVPVSVPNWTDCLVLLEQGQIAAVSTDNSVLVGLADQDPDTQMVKTAPFSCEPHGLAMSDSPSRRDFVRFVNGVLEQMRTDGEWQRLYDQWVNPYLAPYVGSQAQPAAEYGTAIEQTCSWLG